MKLNKTIQHRISIGSTSSNNHIRFECPDISTVKCQGTSVDSEFIYMDIGNDGKDADFHLAHRIAKAHCPR